MKKEMMEKYSFTHESPYDAQTAEDHDFVTPIFTLFLNESSLVIKEEVKAKGANGGWFYKPLNGRAYRSYSNEHGEKYLRAFRKTGSGQNFSTGVEHSKYDPFLYDQRSGRRFCDEMIALIESHLSKILGFPFTYKIPPVGNKDGWYEDEKSWENAPETLYYPFLRNDDNKKWMAQLVKEDHLRRLESSIAYASNFQEEGVRGITAAWRNSKSKEDFIRSMVYKSAVPTDEDLDYLLTNPSHIRLFSNLNLKMGAKEAADRGYVEVFQNAYKYMSVSELHGFRFLLSNLPKRMTAQALDLGVQLMTFRKQQESSGMVENLCKLVEVQSSYSYSSPQNKGQASNYFRLIPAFDRQEFAILFFEEFRKAYGKTEGNYASLPEAEHLGRLGHRDSCFTEVMDAWMKVYSVMQLKMLTSDSIDQCAATAVELFGVDISQDNTLKTGSSIVDELDVTVHYYDFREHVSEQMGRFGYQAFPEPSNLFKLFRKHYDPITHLWVNSFNKPALPVFRDYLELSGSGQFMLATDLEHTLRQIAVVIDKELLTVGQLLTPENRMLYLQAGYDQKRFKSSWRYYHMGVPVDETSLYKKAGFKSKKNILHWLGLREALPIEMYKELLSDAAGVTPENNLSHSF